MLFSTLVKVPASVVKEIGEKIFRTFFEQVYNDTTVNFSDEQMDRLRFHFQQSLTYHMDTNSKSVDGFVIPSESALKISDCLRKQLRIAAIKEFRSATNADLITAKRIIDKFPANEDGAKKFLDSFI